MLRYLLLFLLFIAKATFYGQEYKGREVVRAELVANTNAIVPGRSFKVGLLLRMEPGWHTYWQNPGDSGMATTLGWELPDGFVAGEIEWPAPKATLEEGDLLTYTFDKEVLLTVPIKAPPNIAAGEVALRARAKWLACEKLCLPGQAELALTLPVASGNLPANEPLFGKYLPPKPISESNLKVQTHVTADKVTVEVEHSVRQEKLQLFPMLSGTESYSRVVLEEFPPNKTRFTYKVQSGPLKGIRAVLVEENHQASRRSWIVELREPEQSASVSLGTSQPRWLLFIFGFLGGLILNVMPCVLPVIGLKILGFVHQAGQSSQKVFRFGLAFVAGIFAWFMGLATFLVVMKTAGQQVNWAFQFQNPVFVLTMGIIVLVFALNLLGAFELVLPAAANSRITQFVAQEGYWGAFMHGVFATLLATPCTAPFLAPALGFALGQPAVTIFAMFATIAAGMSLPYFLLTARPAWLGYLPRPGIWMVRVKQAMGLLLLGTAFWLAWIFYQQSALPARGEVPFEVQLEKALASKQHVFVDFTADWCINCKVNERLVLNSAAVQKAFAEHGVIFLKADWTRGDEYITKLLKSFGRAGVPLYVIYPAENRRDTKILPELLTREVVINALNQL